MSDKYRPAELYGKVDWEGGLYEAAFEYGISSDAIDDSTAEGAELKSAWAAMELAHTIFGPAFDKVEKLMSKHEYGEDE